MACEHCKRPYGKERDGFYIAYDAMYEDEKQETYYKNARLVLPSEEYNNSETPIRFCPWCGERLAKTLKEAGV